MASLAGCVGFYAERFLRRHDLPAEGLEVRCDYEMSEDRPARVASVQIEVVMPTRLLPSRNKALRQVVEHCTVHNTIRLAPEIRVSVAARQRAGVSRWARFVGAGVPWGSTLGSITLCATTTGKGETMNLTDREWWAIIHGMGLGALFLLAFAGGLAEFYGLRSGDLTERGLVKRTRRLQWGTWIMAAAAWLTVTTGTWVVYPWYRDPAPDSPRSLLLADPNRADWHSFGMEWKEHVAWIAPLLATAVAFAVTYYGTSLIRHQGVRRALMVFFTVAFVIAGIAGALGAFITKAAPVS